MNVNSGNEGMNCPVCGAVNKLGYRFCVKCGAKLPALEPKPEIPKASAFGAFDEAAPADLSQGGTSFGVFEQSTSKEEQSEATFGVFEQSTSKEEQSEATFGAFEQSTSEEEQSEATVGAFEQETPKEEQSEAAFGAFEQTESKTKPAKDPAFGAFEQSTGPTDMSPDRGFARSGYTGAVTPTPGVGAFATAVDALKNDKKIDVSDAETVLSLLEQGEVSALAKGLPDWDIVPPQIVVRRKHRV